MPPPHVYPPPHYPPYHPHPPPPHAPYPPHLHPPPHQPHTYPPGPHYAPPYPFFVPGTMMVPVPTSQPETQPQPQPTYITNYIYHGEGSTSGNASAPAITDTVHVVETSGDYDWVPSTALTANYLTGRAVIGGHEGWDGSPLWVIRAWHNGDLVPGKFSVRHNAASIMYDGKEISVQNIDVLCAKPDNLRWVPSSNGSVPPGAIIGGQTASGEQLYVGRARHQLSVTPGKVHPSHNCCYIGFAGAEVAHKVYDVLSRIS